MRTIAAIGMTATMLGACYMDGPQYCEGDWAAVSPADEPVTPMQRVVAQVQPTESKAVDMLFVIDDSRSMTDEQTQLGIWSNELFGVLKAGGELPDLHIGVVSSSVSIQGIAACETAPSGAFQVGSATLRDVRYIRDIATPTGRDRNYDGTLSDTFAKMARVGDAGCGFEQPFKAATIALSTSRDFLRPEALLLVVFVTDEDDCSAVDPLLFADEDWGNDGCTMLGPATSYRCFEHGVRCYDGKGSRAFGDRSHCHPNETSPYTASVHRFAEYLKGLKADPGQVIVAGIYGKPNHIRTVTDENFPTYRAPRLENVCGTGGVEGTGATPAVRMNALMAEFGGRASQSSICESQLSWAMRDVGLVTRDVARRGGCLRGPLVDTNLALPGVQPRCRVEVSTLAGERAFVPRVEIPACESAAPGARCYTLATDERGCETESHVGVHLSSQGKGETVFVSCDVHDEYSADRTPDVGTRP